MPNKCGVVNSTSNYHEEKKCRVFRLPKEESKMQKWIDKLPPRENFVVNPAIFFICERHWEANPPVIKLPGGSTRPSIPPSVFNVPVSSVISRFVLLREIRDHAISCSFRGFGDFFAFFQL